MFNRRTSPRINLDETLDMCIKEPELKNIPIRIDEISYKGLRFKSVCDLNVEELSFIIPTLDEHEMMSGKIVWKKHDGQNYIYGLEIFRTSFVRN
ncbi:hypothetical protein [Bacillus pinisoli]|uniref:hypothetical protein n=1 Tax=Bacillus pinisoli TaxID=2901866 RepID=UPI001FF4E634|nr:hypothetical protein [Bacillus pinisoli]